MYGYAIIILISLKYLFNLNIYLFKTHNKYLMKNLPPEICLEHKHSTPSITES